MAAETSGDIFKPSKTKDIADIVAWAVSEAKPLEIIGGGTKRMIGRPEQTGHKLDLSAMTGITLYEPEELVLRARAGTSLADIQHALGDHHQELAFEPPDWRGLLGVPDDPKTGPTIGGILAANLSGPRRFKAGAARDHLLGIEAVSGRGEMFKSGGRVVKNVTGYDLCKLICGSWGTLAVMGEVAVKVLPASERTETVVVWGLSDRQAIEAMVAALKSACDISGAAHLPAALTGNIAEAFEGAPGKRAATMLRLEGFAPSVANRRDNLVALMQPFGRCDVMDAGGSSGLWRAIRDVAVFGPADDGAIWRVSIAPTDAARFVAALSRKIDVEAFYDWAGGLVWLKLAPGRDGAAKLVRNTLARFGGHATLIRAAHDIRKTADVFHPEPAAIAELSGRIKRGLDPAGILNPRRTHVNL